MSTGSAVPPTRTLTGHTGGVTACAISPDSSFIVSASKDHTLKIWDAATRVNPFVVGPPGNRRSWWQFWRRG